MSGTTIGGKRAAISNKKLYGEDFYRKIGEMGGRTSRNGGFASSKIGPDGLDGPTRARMAGAVGGATSRRPASEITRKMHSDAMKRAWDKRKAEGKSTRFHNLRDWFNGKVFTDEN